jgi:hypothetical protein
LVVVARNCAGAKVEIRLSTGVQLLERCTETVAVYLSDAVPQVTERGASLELLSAAVQEKAVAELPGWPVSVEELVPQTLAVADFGGIGGLATVFHQTNGVAHALRADGQPMDGWPVGLGEAFTSTMPAAMDLNDDGTEEIVLALQQLHVVSSDGVPLAGWPIEVTGDGFQARTPIGARPDRGSAPLVFAGTSKGTLVVADSSAMFRPGWPVVLPPIDFPQPRLGNIAVGRILGQGALDVVATNLSEARIFVYDMDGNIVPPFPVQEGRRLEEPTIGDVDQDGRNEIIFWTDRTSEGKRGVVVLGADGTVKEGWPQETHAANNWGVALGDVDNDGKLELAVSTVNGGPANDSAVHLWNDDGSPVENWPQYVTDVSFPNPVALADVNGDGLADIIAAGLTASISADGVIFAWTTGGELIGGFPIVIPGRPIMTAAGPTVADVNEDGVAELGIMSQAGLFGSGPTRIHWFNLGVPYRPEGMEWPTRAHDMARTGSYSPPVRRVSMRVQLFPPVMHANTPAPPLTAIFTLPRDASGGPTTFSLVKVDDEAVDPVEGQRLGGWLDCIKKPRRLVFRFDGEEVRSRLGSAGEHELIFRSEAIGGLGGVQYEATASLTLTDVGWRFGRDREVENGDVGRHQVPLTRSTDLESLNEP